MKLLFVIIQDDDAKPLMRALVEDHFSVTRISTTGGFLHSGNTTLLIGVEEDKVDQALKLIEQKSSRRRAITVAPSALAGQIAPMPIEVTVGGATVFLVDVEAFHKF